MNRLSERFAQRLAVLVVDEMERRPSGSLVISQRNLAREVRKAMQRDARLRI